MESPEHLKILEAWMKSYRPEELFDADGALVARLQALAPKGVRRMGANPVANGGLLLKDLRMPDFRTYAVEVKEPGVVIAEATRVMGKLLRDVMRLNLDARNFRVFGPDETSSNRLDALFEVTDKTWLADTTADDDSTVAARTGDGNFERAYLSGVARGLSAHGTPWLVFFLRGLHSHRRLDVQPARQMAQDHEQGNSLARAHRLAQLSALVPCLASGPQRLFAPGSRLHRSCRATKKPT